MRIALLLLFAAAPTYRQALPGYRYQFPRDHFEHTDFRTEWWYYTGNVHDSDRHRYGFELVFFKRYTDKDRLGHIIPMRLLSPVNYYAHFAVTDIDAKQFRYSHQW